MHELLIDGDGERTIVLAHGAGAPMDSDFMNSIATGIAAGGLRVVRFEFPYMVQRRNDGKKRPPNGAAILERTWREVIEQSALGGDASNIVVGGKSMGGRIASMIADDAGVGGLVCLGYPFHPPGKPEKLRTGHLAELRTPTLIVQGERDPFGGHEEVGAYELSSAICFEWAPDGDHSLVPRKRSGHTREENLDAAVGAILSFVNAL